jgi:transcriptional regulator with XRE-family HTH domain
LIFIKRGYIIVMSYKKGGEFMKRERAGDLIRTARIRNGLTQVELANRLNVTQGSVGCWEIGKTLPRPKSMVKLCEILKIPIDDLIKAG